MVRLLKQFARGEKGQALPIVLALLAIGGLTIAPSLNYATTVLNSNRMLDDRVKGFYAADAGVEEAVWSLENGIWSIEEGESLSTPLSENISQMSVAIKAENLGTYTMYLDDLIRPEPGTHTDWLNVDGEITNVGGSTCNYTITISRSDDAKGNIRLVEVGATLPAGYTYITDSAALFPENLSTANPTDNGTTAGGAQWLKWQWATGHGPYMTANHTQAFQIEGTGSTDGTYAWVIAQSNDVGIVGEITGTLYRITSTATRPEDGKTTGKIVAEMMTMGGMTYIFSWQIAY